jgi:hypothetical protein
MREHCRLGAWLSFKPIPISIVNSHRHPVSPPGIAFDQTTSFGVATQGFIFWVPYPVGIISEEAPHLQSNV